MQRPVLRWSVLVGLTITVSTFIAYHAFVQTTQSATNESAAPALTTGQVDQLVAPVALYPDPLLANVLIASTYPLEVAIAARWAEENKSLTGNALKDAVARQTWDDSVKSLAYAPVVLAMMSKQIDWTNKLGEAFLSNQADVIAAVQRLRKQAQAAGKLQSSEQQTVTTEGDTIYIEPAESAMYVPYYDPMDVYGSWAWDDYPPYYWPAPPGYGFLRGFFAGAIIAGIWNGSINYPGHHVTINNNVDRFSRRGTAGGQAWRHNPEHRQGVNYARPDLQTRYGAGNLAGSDARRDFRGFDATHGTDRGFNPEGSSRRSFDRGGGFDGVGHGASTRSYSDRGFSSHGMRGGGFGGFRGGGRGGRR